jgi:hypothetical protein
MTLECTWLYCGCCNMYCCYFNLFCIVWVCVRVGFVMCVTFGNVCTWIYCVLYCLYCVFCIVSFMCVFLFVVSVLPASDNSIVVNNNNNNNNKRRSWFLRSQRRESLAERRKVAFLRASIKVDNPSFWRNAHSLINFMQHSQCPFLLKAILPSFNIDQIYCR